MTDCPLCRDPEGAHLLSSVHTWDEGCLFRCWFDEYVAEQVAERKIPMGYKDLGYTDLS